MITRIEIDGFKSFADFSLDLPPFLAVIGTNASGKSNLLDALRFLSVAVKRGITEAAKATRGDPRGLFRQRSDGSRVDRMRFAVELLQEAAERKPTRWRYEVEISWSAESGRLEGLRLARERLGAVDAASDTWPFFVDASTKWRTVNLRYGDSGQIEEIDPADGQESRLGHTSLLELQGTEVFHFEADSLRRLSELGESWDLEMQGGNLPNYLRYLQNISVTDIRPRGVLADISAQLVGLVRDITGFDVIVDERRRDVRVEFTSEYAEPYGAAFASDGTLRMLAILAVANEPDAYGLAAIEEPENGVFPERLRHLLGLLGELAADPAQDDPDEPMRQIIITSHSPVVLEAVPRNRIVFLDSTTLLERGVPSRVTRVRRLRQAGGPARVTGEHHPRVTESEIAQFLAGLEIAEETI